MTNKRVAVVTGANRGIGFEISRQLARLGGYLVIMTSRSRDKGLTAQSLLARDGFAVEWRPLDVTDQASVEGLMNHLRESFGRVDVLVNNAGVFLDRGQSVLEADLSLFHQTFRTNLFGPLFLTQKMVPLMLENNYGRVVNVSSAMGQFAVMGGGSGAYRISKAALNALTCVVADELAGTNVLVNSMTPGWVRTDMGGADAHRSVEEGADTAVWLATLPPDGPTGKFFKDRQEIPW